MTKENMKDLLLGRAVRYLENNNYNYWELMATISLIVEKYASYDMKGMEEELYKYCKNLKEVK